MARGELDLDGLDALAADLEARSDSLRQLTTGLGLAERRLLAVLAAVPGAAMPASAVGAISGVDDAEATLGSLRDAGLVRAASPRYRIPPDVAAILDLPDWRSTTLQELPLWLAADNDVGDVAETAPAALSLLRWGVEQRRWADVIGLARVVAPPLGATRRWGMLRNVLAAAREAAEASSDAEALGWALHEVGTIDVCAGQVPAGVDLLRRAEGLRESAGDVDGLAVTRHNLEQAVPVGPPPEVPPPEEPKSQRPTESPPSGWPGWLKLLLAVLIIAGIGAVAVLVWPRPDPPEGVGSLAVDTQPIDFGTVTLGSEPREQRLIRNVGTGRSDVIVFLEESERFDVESDCGLLDPGEACSITIGFFTEESGEYGDVLIVADESTGSDVAIEVRGAVNPEDDVRPPVEPSECDGFIEFDTSPIDFGSVPPGATVGEQRVVVNQTSCPIEFIDVFLAASENFGLESSCGFLDVGDSCPVVIVFFTDEPGEYDDVLVVDAGGVEFRVDVEVRGIVQAGTSILRAVPPDELDLATGDTISLFNSGTIPLELVTIELESGEAFEVVEPFCSPVLQPQESCGVHVVLFDRSTEGRRDDVLLIRHSGDNPDYAITVFTLVIN
jgi:hypothetical protein